MLKTDDGHLVEIKVLNITGRIVRLGIQAPKEIDITRAELVEPKTQEK